MTVQEVNYTKNYIDELHKEYMKDNGNYDFYKKNGYFDLNWRNNSLKIVGHNSTHMFYLGYDDKNFYYGNIFLTVLEDNEHKLEVYVTQLKDGKELYKLYLGHL